MYAVAKRTDSWLGIELGKVYDIEVINNKMFVRTNGYTVPFNEKDFEVLSA